MTGQGPRVPLLPLEEARAKAVEARLPEAVASENIVRVWLHRPELARSVLGLLGTLLWKGKVDQRLRELMIMRLAWATGSVYEWTQHWKAVAQLGLDPAEIVAVRDWRTSDRFGPDARAVLGAVDDVVADGFVSEDTWGQLVEHVSSEPAVLVEIVHVAAFWRLVSTVARSLDVPIEDGAVAWPPDGRAP